MAIKVKKKKSLKDKIMLTVSIVLLTVTVVLTTGVVLLESRFFKDENGLVDSQGGLLSNQQVKTEKHTNFLVCGINEGLTDVIMVVSVNHVDNTVEVLQIPRDTFVGLGTTGKINEVYNFSNRSDSRYEEFSKLTPINRLIRIINEQYQIRIDHYATVDLVAFRNIVDAMGGIPINLPNKIKEGNITLYPGEQVLNGAQAEAVVRHRHSYVEGDIGRVKVQRLFLASALKKVKTMGKAELVAKVLPQIYDQFSTDMTLKEMIDFAEIVFKIDMNKVRIHIIPGQGDCYYGPYNVWGVHKESTAELLNKYFRPFSDDVSAEILPIIEIKNTGNYYEDTENDFEGLLNGEKPGGKNESEDDTESSND